MAWRMLTVAIAALGALGAFASAQAEPRMALVIGNSAYQAVTELPNPANDAKAMAELLSAAGFEVTTAPDLGQAEMRKAIGDFAAKVAERGPDTVSLVFYAGHGLQVDGENFLVPVDARIAREADVPLQTVRLADVMNALAAVPSKTRIVILDACRNNPFSEINKVVGRGLAIVDAPSGSIVSYSTAPGSEAEDGEGSNSPYTRALLGVAREPGMPIEQAFKRVRYAVHQVTAGRQTPWESSSLTADFAFFPGVSTAAPVVAATEAAPAAAGRPGGRPAATPASVGGVPGQKVAALGGPRIAIRSVESWRDELRPLPQFEAYERVIREDTLEAYQAYLQLFSAAPFQVRVREIVERRKVMVAWYTAVTVNTPASYELFMAQYPDSDLLLTARRLFERAGNRQIAIATPVVAAPCICTPAPAVQPTRRKTEKPEKEKKSSKPSKRTAVRDSGPPPPPPPPPPSGPPVSIGVIGIPIGPIGPRPHGHGPVVRPGGHSHGPVGSSSGGGVRGTPTGPVRGGSPVIRSGPSPNIRGGAGFGLR
ncbi:caspase family protein [Rhodoplanes tepidamans]|uniref:caspase family protein n=1 Tax=Rhodoplanes tepidamans TaxID=200616 RepID=UPI003F590733